MLVGSASMIPLTMLRLRQPLLPTKVLLLRLLLTHGLPIRLLLIYGLTMSLPPMTGLPILRHPMPLLPTLHLPMPLLLKPPLSKRRFLSTAPRPMTTPPPTLNLHHYTTTKVPTFKIPCSKPGCSHKHLVGDGASCSEHCFRVKVVESKYDADGWVCWECKMYYNGRPTGKMLCVNCGDRGEKMANYVMCTA
jgi:hypothetical protein